MGKCKLNPECGPTAHWLQRLKSQTDNTMHWWRWATTFTFIHCQRECKTAHAKNRTTHRTQYHIWLTKLLHWIKEARHKSLCTAFKLQRWQRQQFFRWRKSSILWLLYFVHHCLCICQNLYSLILVDFIVYEVDLIKLISKIKWMKLQKPHANYIDGDLERRTKSL